MVELIVNGSRLQFDGPQDTPLLLVLRNDFGLKAARFGCGSGECGACRVLIEGRAVAACDLPVWAALGKPITTVEGLGSPESPHPLQRALLEEQGAQCGYCLGGILISAAALLATNSAPSEAEVRRALDDNLCRCGAHNRIVRAVLKAAQARE